MLQLVWSVSKICMYKMLKLSSLCSAADCSVVSGIRTLIVVLCGLTTKKKKKMLYAVNSCSGSFLPLDNVFYTARGTCKIQPFS